MDSRWVRLGLMVACGALMIALLPIFWLDKHQTGAHSGRAGKQLAAQTDRTLDQASMDRTDSIDRVVQAERAELDQAFFNERLGQEKPAAAAVPVPEATGQVERADDVKALAGSDAALAVTTDKMAEATEEVKTAGVTGAAALVEPPASAGMVGSPVASGVQNSSDVQGSDVQSSAVQDLDAQSSHQQELGQQNSDQQGSERQASGQQNHDQQNAPVSPVFPNSSNSSASSAASDSSAPPASTSKSAASEQAWRVQMGSFVQPINAERLQQRLKLHGYDAVIKDSRSGRFMRVVTGAVASREAALELQRELKREVGLDGIVVHE